MDVDLVKETTVSKIEKRQMSVDNLWELDAGELGKLTDFLRDLSICIINQAFRGNVFV